MFDIYIYLLDVADAFAVSGGFINTTLSLVFYALSFSYGAAILMLPFNVWKIANNIRR